MSSTQEVGEIFGAGSGPAHAMLRSPTVLIAAIGLWGMNIYFFKLFQIDYIRVLKHDLLKLDGSSASSSSLSSSSNAKTTTTMTATTPSRELLRSSGHNGGTHSYPTNYDSEDDASNDQEQPLASSIIRRTLLAPPSTSLSMSKKQLHAVESGTKTSRVTTRLVNRATTSSTLLHTTQSDENHRTHEVAQVPQLSQPIPTPVQRTASHDRAQQLQLPQPLTTITDDERKHTNDSYIDDDEQDYLYGLDTESMQLVKSDKGLTSRLASQLSMNYNNAITWDRLVALSILLLVLLHFSYYWWIDVMGGGTIGAVFSFYAAVMVAIVLPVPSTKWLRKATVITIVRTAELVRPRCSSNGFCSWLRPQTTNSTAGNAFWRRNINASTRLNDDGVSPARIDLILPRPIPFVDVFYADAMCSLSKVFFDWGMLFHMFVYYPNPVPASTYNILIPSLAAALPYIIRTRQCLIMYIYTSLQHDSHRYSHMANAVKYTTSIFPLCMSAYQKTVSASFAENLEPYLILLLIINSVYALYWDIVMDWGMMQTPSAVVVRSASAVCVGSRIMGSKNGTNNSNNNGNFSTSIVNGDDGPSTSTLSKVPFEGVHHRGPALSTLSAIQNGINAINPNSGIESSTSLLDPTAEQHYYQPQQPSMSQSCGQTFLRPRLRFGVPLSVLILFVDIILRFGWTLRFYQVLFPSNDAFILFTQFLEVFRRALWNLLRVEWESLKQIKDKATTTSDAADANEIPIILCSSVNGLESGSIAMSAIHSSTNQGDHDNNATTKSEEGEMLPFLVSNKSFAMSGKIYPPPPSLGKLSMA
jgi:hypothetical protein